MRVLGNVELAGLGQILNLRAENLAADPAAPIVGQVWYNTTDGVYRGFDGTTVIEFSSAADLGELRALVETGFDGAGLGEDGVYSAPADSNYLSAATSLHNADTLLDSQVKALSEAIDQIGSGNLADMQTEIDATQAGAGLGVDGAYAVQADANYIAAATSLFSADVALDAAVKTVETAAAAAQTSADEAQTAAEAAQTTADAALPLAGGVMTGAVQMSNNKIAGLAAPTEGTDAVNKAYVDSAMAGLDFQPDVLAIQRNAEFAPAKEIGARYIIGDAAALHVDFGTIADFASGDIVEFDGEAFVVVYDVSVQGEGAIAWNREDDTFSFYDGASWSNFGGMTGVVAGVGIDKQGNTINVKLGAGVGNLPTGEVGLDIREAAGLFLTEDGATDSSGTDAKLALKIAADRGLAVSAAGLEIADNSVSEFMLASTAFGDGLSGGNGDTVVIVPKADGGIIVDGDGVSIDPSVLQFVKLEGDTMTGPLVLSADPIEDMEAATKQYVDAAAAAAGEASDAADDVLTRLTNSFHVYDGTVSQLSHTVDHNIGQKYCNVTVVDSADQVILPDTITFVSSSQLIVTFASAITCKVVVSGLGELPGV